MCFFQIGCYKKFRVFDFGVKFQNVPLVDRDLCRSEINLTFSELLNAHIAVMFTVSALINYTS